jgi:hypothetical protein
MTEIRTVRTAPITIPAGARRCESGYLYGGLSGDQCGHEIGHDGPHESKSIGFSYAGYRWIESEITGAQGLLAYVFNYPGAVA